MKNLKINYLKHSILLALICFLSVNCQRDMSDDATVSTYSKNGEVFIDGFSAGLGYGAFGGSKYTAFTVDKEVKYEGTASMRFDVPSYGDASGSYAGGVYIDGSGRNLTDFDAITFWVKGSQAASLNSLGFGVDFGLNKYKVEMSNVSIGTNWQKVTIPIPDASKLIQEKGLFWYSEGPENNLGYTFWIDNVKYEKLGTIAHASPAIMGGVDTTQQTFIGSSITLTGLTDSFNMASGLNQTISVAPGYYTFTSSNINVATVNEQGVVSIVGSGTSVIRATLTGIQALGSLTINSLGVFIQPPTPTKPAANVISIFSNAYTNVPVNYTNGYWAPYQTTTSADFAVNGNNILNYQNFNFVGIEFSSPTINASSMTFMHLDVFVPNTISPSASFKVKIIDFGADGNFGGTGANSDLTSSAVSFSGSSFVSGTWKSIDINLSNFTGLPNKLHLAQIVFDSTVNNLSSISNVYVDNIYFYN